MALLVLVLIHWRRVTVWVVQVTENEIAELNEQLEWAQTDRDEALTRITSLEGELAAQRSAVREGRSRVARLQVEKDDAVRENTRLRESVR